MSNPLKHDYNCLTIDELQALAAQNMNMNTRNYYNEGSDSNSTLKENITAYHKYRIRPRVMRDVSNIDTTTQIFDFKNAFPCSVAPTAMQCLAHHEGELATARACNKLNITMGLSSFSTKTLEEVALQAPNIPKVLQLYLFEERAHSIRLINRAKKAGFKAVFLTVDTPVLGRRNAEIRSRFKLPPPYRIANFERNEEISDETLSFVMNQPGGRKPPSGPITFHTHAANPTLSWERDIPFLIDACKPMQVWVKGIATAEDAELAVKYGCHGIVVSNHGGRQLNGALATLDALPDVVEAVGGRIPVHVDGGIRHGTDIFKAIALGASMVYIGRPVLWGLAYKGQEGVEHALRLLMDEFKLCCGLAGITSVDQINKDYLVKIDASGFISRL